MGGAKAGEVAAQMAVDAVARLVGPVHADDVRGAIERANRAIRRLATDDPDKSGMGTTLTAAMLEDGHLDVVHVGDSRAYLWRDGELRQITEDHSVVAELVRRGSITAEEAESHPHRNVITRALGAEPQVVTRTSSRQYLEDGDVVLLCSDGLSSYVPEAAIAEVLAGADSLDAAAKGLVARANGAGGADNVTVVLARVAREEDPSGDTAEAPAVAPPASADPGDTAHGGEVRVLGGMHGQVGRPEGATSAHAEACSSPCARRRSRALPVVAGLVVVLAARRPAPWPGSPSRSYGLEEGPDGTVQVTHGLPCDVLGQDLSRLVAGDRRAADVGPGHRPRGPSTRTRTARARPSSWRPAWSGATACPSRRPSSARVPPPDTAPGRARPTPATTEPPPGDPPRTRELGS